MIKELVRQVMAAKKLNQQDLADLTGASLSRVKAITSGRVAKLKPEEIRALVEELDVSADWLATGSGEIFRPRLFQEETQDQFIDRMQAIKATGLIVDAMGLPDRDRDGLKACLTGDPAMDGVLIAEAVARQKQQMPQITSYPKATVTPLPANEHAGLTWRELMILAVDELNAAGLHLPGEKLAEMVDLLMEFQREGLPVSRDSVARQIRLVA